MYRLYSHNTSGYVRLFFAPESYDAQALRDVKGPAFGPLIRDTQIVMYLSIQTSGMGRHVYLRILWDDRIWNLSYENLGNKVENI